MRVNFVGIKTKSKVDVEFREHTYTVKYHMDST